MSSIHLTARTSVKRSDEWRKPSKWTDTFGAREDDRENFGLACYPNREAALLFYALADDLDSIEIAFRDFERTSERIRGAINAAIDRTAGQPTVRESLQMQADLFHYAKTFICAVRRFARLLEAAPSRIGRHQKALREAVRLAWRQNKAFLEGYTGARNAIEHVDGEINPNASRFSQVVAAGQFYVTPAAYAAVTPEAMTRVLAIWEDLAKVGKTEHDRWIGSLLSRERLLRALKMRGYE
jgi:hypothetical protein